MANRRGGRTLLIFGGGGQLGGAIGALPAPPGWRVFLAAREHADIAQRAAVARLLARVRPEVIVNAAAYTAVDDAQSSPQAADRANRQGAAVVASAAARAGVPVIHLSTDYVFDGTADRPLRESDPVAPLSVYGITKEAGERAVREATARHVILRTSWLFGRHGKNFVRTMLELGVERPALRIVADQHGCPTSADDLARAIWQIAMRIIRPSPDMFGTFHFAGAGPTTWFGFAERIFAEVALRGLAVPRLEPIASSDYPATAPRPAYSVLDCAKIRAAFGIAPASWDEGLVACVGELAVSALKRPKRKGAAA